MSDHRPTLAAALLLASSAASAVSSKALSALDSALAERQRNQLSTALTQLDQATDHPEIYFQSELGVPLSGLRVALRSEHDAGVVATFDFSPVPSTRLWKAQLPRLDAGAYMAQLEVKVQGSTITLDQKLPWTTATALVEWRLEERLVRAPGLDSTHWLHESPGWWSTALDWVVPDGARQRLLAEQPRQRPDYRAAQAQCAAGRIQGLAGMLHTHRTRLLDTDLVDDLLDCAATLDLRAVVYEVLNAWPDGVLSSRGWDVMLSVLRRDIAHGHSARALQALTRRAPLQQTASQEARWRDLVSRVMLARGDIAAALTYLREGPHMQADQTLVGDADLQLLFQTMRLNLAVALLHAERGEDALNLLDQIGQVTPSSQAVAALRDRANVMLGWQFLHRQQGLTAQAVFNRVDLHGDAAATALLGRGYALVAPPGERQLRNQTADATNLLQAETASTLAAKYRGGFISCEQYQQAMGDDAVCTRTRAFDQAGEHYSPQEREQRAMRSWLLVAERGGADLATQEARLQAAVALIEAGRRAPAQDMLERAIDILEQRQQEAAQEQQWLREYVLASLAGADEAFSQLRDSAELPPLATHALARWLAQEQIRALLDMQVRASGWPEQQAQVQHLLLQSLAQLGQQINQQQARMESEIRLHLAKLYHQGALGG